MRFHVIILAMAILMSGCRTKKNMASQSYSNVDSIAVSGIGFSSLAIDSIFRESGFSFDSLEVIMARPVAFSDTPVTVRITATKGKFERKQKQWRNDVKAYNRLDSVAFHHNSTETSRAETDTKRVMKPPDGTIFILLSFILATVAYFILRKE